jgi:hypothetical protein
MMTGSTTAPVRAADAINEVFLIIAPNSIDHQPHKRRKTSSAILFSIGPKFDNQKDRQVRDYRLTRDLSLSSQRGEANLERDRDQ